MKLRIAKKVFEKMDILNYRSTTLNRASSRQDKTRTTKETNKYWYNLLDEIGPEGRAYLLKNDCPGAALRILMEN